MMVSDDEKKYQPRSGKIAVEMGFITIEQLKEAISEQIDDDIANRPHRFLLEILFNKGWMKLEQIDIILDEIFKEEMRSKGIL